MKIAWLGTGLIGGPMAERFLGCGHELAVWNRTAAKAAPLAARGARVTTTSAEAVAAAEFVFTMLRDGPVTRAVLLDGGPGALRGRVVVQMATIASAESRALASAVAADGGEYLEAPVLGSLPAARAGKLLVFAGGPGPLFARCLPLLARLGEAPVLAGPVGAAATLKLAFNQLIGAEVAGFTLSLAMVRRAGVEVDLFLSILRGSSFFAPAFEQRLARYLERRYDHPNFTLELLLKDEELAASEARALGLATEAVDGVRALVAKGVARGLGALDYGALYEAVDPPDSGAGGTSWR